MYFILVSINIWPSKEKKSSTTCQQIFKNDIPIHVSSLIAQNFFNRKICFISLSIKYFLDIQASQYLERISWNIRHDAVTFISSLFSGCISDIDITKNSGLIELLEPGVQIMADKGFVLNKLLEGTWVTIATPHFM